MSSEFDSFRESEWAYWYGEWKAKRNCPRHYVRMFERNAAESSTAAVGMVSGAVSGGSTRREVQAVIDRVSANLISKEAARRELQVFEEVIEPAAKPEPDEYVGMVSRC